MSMASGGAESKHMDDMVATVGEEHCGSSPSPAALIKQTAINNNNTEDFVSEHDKMKEAYGSMYSNTRDISADADGDSGSDRVFDSNGDFNPDDDDSQGMLVIKPIDTEMGVSPSQSLLGGASRRKLGGGGRRKQSKPIRVYFDYDPVEGESAEMPHAAAGQEAIPEEGYQNRGEAGMKDTRMEVDETVSCDLCFDTFLSQAQLNAHVANVHAMEKDADDENFPTKYHQLGNQLMQHQDAVMTITPEETPGERPQEQQEQDQEEERPRFSPASSQGDASNTSQGDAPAADGSIKPGSRIFHPDAYCELCSREFCNKYFLKTHKANKHGIYESCSPNSSLPPMPLPSMPSDYPAFVMPPLGSLPPMPPVSMPMSLAMSMSESLAPTTNSLMTTAPSMVKQERPTPPSSVPPMGVHRGVPNENPGDKSSNKSHASMEDYCEICQKHFCNKYYLKKHKHDVHGIVPNTPTLKRSRTTPLSSSSGGNSTPASATPNSINTTSAPTPLGIPHSPGSIASNGNGLGIPNMAAMANVMFINPFSPPMFIHTQPMLQAGPGGFLANGLPALPQVPHQVPPSELQLQQKLRGPPSSTSPQNISLQGDALRSIGVLNADAYCELCRKEFCNKYFLRIHKANKHGIFTEEGIGEEGLEGMTATPQSQVEKGSAPREASRASPLSEHQADGDKIESAAKGDEVYTCRVCNKDFHSKQSFKIHNMNVHGYNKSQEDRKPTQMDMDMALAAKMAAASGGLEAGELVNKHPPPHYALEGLMAKNMNMPHSATSDHANISSTMFGNMIAAKLADRVMCELCNKEVCNKYFLKTHKLKVHGIIPEPTLEKEKEREKRKNDDFCSGFNNCGPADLSMKSKETSVNPAEVKRPNDQELLKMGIDPEAYCEICKKEFCSKYFLKTHKLNIHGIKVENSIPREVKHRDSLSMNSLPSHSLPSSIGLPVSSTMSTVSQHLAPSLSSIMNMAPTMVPSLPPVTTNGALNSGQGPHMMPNLFNFHIMPETSEMSERRSWKWKEPINATRVMCDLCNKELCNKYFLKTHMLNKHGLYWDHITGQTTPSGKRLSPSSSKHSSTNNTPSSTPPIDTKPTTTSTCTTPTSMYDIKAPTTNGGLVFLDPVAQQQRGGVIVSKEGSHRDMEQGNDSKQQMAQTPKSEPNLPASGDNIPASTVTAKTWHVPPAIQEQNSYTNGKPFEGKVPGLPNGAVDDRGLNSDSYIHKCDLCGLLFREALTLHLHKMQDHGLQMSKPPSYQDIVQIQDARYSAAMATYSLKKKYQNSIKRKFRANRRWRRLGQNMGVIGEKVKSAIMNHIANHQRRKKYRCAHCQERFFSRPLCQAHIRADHPNARFTEPSDSDSKDGQRPKQLKQEQQQQQRSTELNVQIGDNQMDTNQAKDCESGVSTVSTKDSFELPVSYATPTNVAPISLQPADAAPPYLMQPFTVQESAGESTNFAKSIVYLPVMRKVSEPVTVTFKLTPAEQ